MTTKTTRVRTAKRLLAVCAALSWCVGARADYASESGMIQILTSPPPSVKSNALQNDTAISTFAEHRDLTLATAVTVDDTAAGTFKNEASLVGGTIAAGTEVDSYFFHSDTASPPTIYDATVTFSTPILGVSVLSDSLSATDAQLGAAGTKYPTGDGIRGLELSRTEDYFTLSADLKTLTLHFNTHGNLDEIRVLTAPTPVPEPATAALLGLGGIGVLGVARLRRSASARGR